jgi:hypothetical protein
MVIKEMDDIAGTHELLRGERPVGVNSAVMIDILRKQALASRSPILQAWDESLQEEGGCILQEVIKHVKNDPRYAERIRILANEKKSRLSIQTFTGRDISDNTNVHIDTASMALSSKEARQAKVIEFMQYAPALMALPMGLRLGVLDELDLKDTLVPQGPDIERAKRMLAWIRQGQFDRVIPFPEDDPYVFYEVFKNEMQSEALWDMDPEQQELIVRVLEVYKQQVQMREQQAMAMQMMMQQNEKGGQSGGGQQQGGKK